MYQLTTIATCECLWAKFAAFVYITLTTKGSGWYFRSGQGTPQTLGRGVVLLKPGLLDEVLSRKRKRKTLALLKCMMKNSFADDNIVLCKPLPSLSDVVI